MRTKRVRSVAVAAVVAAGLALVVSAWAVVAVAAVAEVGRATRPRRRRPGKTFPVLKAVWGTTDYLDPGLSYRLESWQLFQDVYMGLVVKAHAELPRTTTAPRSSRVSQRRPAL